MAAEVYVVPRPGRRPLAHYKRGPGQVDEPTTACGLIWITDWSGVPTGRGWWQTPEWAREQGVRVCGLCAHRRAGEASS